VIWTPVRRKGPKYALSFLVKSSSSQSPNELHWLNTGPLEIESDFKSLASPGYGIPRRMDSSMASLYSLLVASVGGPG
jgi:hypothetical protein